MSDDLLKRYPNPIATPNPLPPQLGGHIPTGDATGKVTYENILKEADRLTSGARNVDYGTPLDNFTQTARLINAAFGTTFTAEDVGLLMILLKVSRQRNRKTRDNLVDIAGYARTIEMVQEERKKRAAEVYPKKESIPDTSSDPVFKEDYPF